MMKKITTPIIILLVAVILFWAGMYWWVAAGMAPNRDGGAVKVFVVTKGEGAASISDRLKEQGLIKSALRFKIYLYVNQPIGKKIQAGSFTLNPGMSAAKIALTLTRASNDRRITIIEGLRQEEIGLLLVKAGFPFQFSDWLTTIRQQKLEGQLFPDTYLIPVDAGIEKVLAIFAKNYQKKVVVGLANAITNSLKFSQSDYLILASLVEREARSDLSRPIVAGIIIKRLETGWPLQVDATVQYIVGGKKCLTPALSPQPTTFICDWWPKKLSKTDLAIKSPYNTYLNHGLPPTPICNPGLSSVKAVLNPTPTDYWFYLTGNDNQMHYAKTVEEHAANIQKYLK